MAILCTASVLCFFGASLAATKIEEYSETGVAMALSVAGQDWVEVEAGDYMWLRAFCPQACYAGGPGPFRYLLYKDVNRHMSLRPAANQGFGQQSAFRSAAE